MLEAKVLKRAPSGKKEHKMVAEADEILDDTATGNGSQDYSVSTSSMKKAHVESSCSTLNFEMEKHFDKVFKSKTSLDLPHERETKQFAQ